MYNIAISGNSLITRNKFSYETNKINFPTNNDTDEKCGVCNHL